MHLLNRSQSGDFLSYQLRPQNSMNSDWPAIMERAFSDSRLQENDRPVLAPIIMDEKHQLMKFENHCGEEMSYMDLEQEDLKWMNRNANYSDVGRQQYEGNVEVALYDNAMVHGNLPNLNFPPSAYHHPLDSQEYGKIGFCCSS
ncbi:hypothetical protein OIU74_014153 [Salix koriyanagi]|uniref:Uncharacterized protein n=1 Tax=Salix koriyanagi TaxID=2511006 RepID=A0A9Q0SYP5_9ROSI|nr:hypothetical protein OIU74_014153 [Salix koriyanagi]